MGIIGITGGIGSGKTTVCSIFAELGVPVYFADLRAKAVMVEDEVLRSAIRTAFGEEAYLGHELNRTHLAQQVFSSEERLAELNSLVHPAVARDFMEWTSRQSGHPYILKEAAILFESGAYKAVNETVLVTAPLEMRIARVMERDRVTREEVLQRMDKQWPEDRKAELADHIIINDGDHLLIPQVLHLHQKFMA